MAHDPLTLKRVKIEALSDFARKTMEDQAYARVAPISLARAESQSKNPQADPGDAALVVAFIKGRCIGYMGLVPGTLVFRGGTKKMAWMSTFFMDPEQRGKGHGNRVVSEIQQLGVDLVANGMTRSVEGLYRGAGFKHLGELSYYRLNLEDPAILKKAVAPLRSRETSFLAKPVDRLSEKTGRQASTGHTGYFLRDARTINWMLANPWLMSREAAGPDVSNYFFSRVRDRFEYKALEVYAPDGETRLGHVVFSVALNRGVASVKILDYGFFDRAHRFIAGYLGMTLSEAADARLLEYPAGLGDFFEALAPLKPFIKRKKRLYMCYPATPDSPLATMAEKIGLGYSDGDTAFT
jgi:ribosomal protein S18 acetylase RimI-like enzyme